MILSFCSHCFNPFGQGSLEKPKEPFAVQDSKKEGMGDDKTNRTEKV